MSLLLPGPHIASLIFDKASASIMNIVWGFVFACLGGLSIALWKMNIFNTERNFYDLVFVLSPLGLYSILCGVGSISMVRFQEVPNFSEKLQTPFKIFFRKQSLLYPLMFILSPVISLVVAFRGIFPHSGKFRSDLLEFKFVESVTKTSNQLCVQIYILLQNIEYPPSSKQVQSICFGILTVAIPAMEKYFHYGRPYSLFNYVQFYPIFTFNILFKILTWSLIFLFFRFFYGVVILVSHVFLLLPINYRIMKKFYPFLIKEQNGCSEEDASRNYKYQVGQMAVQAYLTIPNLQDTPPARFCRKFSLYANFVFNVIFLLILLILWTLNTFPQFACRPFFGDCHHDPKERLPSNNVEISKLRKFYCEKCYLESFFLNRKLSTSVGLFSSSSLLESLVSFYLQIATLAIPAICQSLTQSVRFCDII